MSEKTGYINVSGGLFTSHFVNQMCEEEAPSSIQYLKASDYQLEWDPDSKFTEAAFKSYIAEQWEDLLLRWNTYGADLDSMDLTNARRFWIRPVLEALGFELAFTPKRTELAAGITFPLSHKGWHPGPGYPLPPIVHIISPSVGLDDKTEERGVRSAHTAVQMYLNNHDERWSVVTNGKELRILRDFYHTSIQGYLEFDLAAIFYFRKFSDFVALFRFCHASRFVLDKEGNCPLDMFFEQSKTVGETIGKDLQKNVRLAIEELGNGFITENPELLRDLVHDAEKCKVFYSDLLKVIYRIIFMLYAEQRGLLVTDKCESLFLSEYSITSLRERVAGLSIVDDNYTDLWEGLTVTFSMLKEGVEELGVPAFNGMLFTNSDGVILAAKKCRNSGVVRALQYLTTTEAASKKSKTRVKQSISYGDISVEEIGGIYEGLLEFTPMVSTGPLMIDGALYPANSFVLNPIGMDRKKTGSYYTNPGLIDALIQSALNPVIEDKLKNAGSNVKEQEAALLSIRVCDPACGSGAFLIAATNRLGLKLAQIRSGSEVPTEQETRDACRDVLSRCIYGVDINPMSVELAKVSLWINALVKGKPLNFLDNHIQCGNSLVGATRDLLNIGIPDEAFNRSDKAEKGVASKVIKQNKSERENYSLSNFSVRKDLIAGCVPEFAKISSAKEDSVEAVHTKEAVYKKLTESTSYKMEKLVCDLWCSAFFWNLKETNRLQDVPTQGVFSSLYNDGIDVSSEMRIKVDELAKNYQFFHWHLAFPDVFSDEMGGFDCILGNPPWETMEMKEIEFFAVNAPSISVAETSSIRKKMIGELKTKNPDLYQEYLSALRDVELVNNYIRNSLRYPNNTKGKINTYAVFSELSPLLINPFGNAGIIVPSGICTDDNTALFFSNLTESKRLVSLYDFENSNGLFPIHRSFKFCLLTISGSSKPIEECKLAFYLHRTEELMDAEKVFTLTPKDLKLINPNTGNCPIFRSKRDVEITKRIYQRVPILWNKKTDANPWKISFSQMFNMSSDSHLFETYSSLIGKGYTLEGNVFVKGEDKWLPLYEAKMVWHYDHRYGDYNTFKTRPSSNLPEQTWDNYHRSEYVVMPWYWVNISNIHARTNAYDSNKWIICFRDVTNSTNMRTLITCIIPYCATNHKTPNILCKKIPLLLKIVLYSNLNSITLDYLVRLKMGGMSMGYFILKQLPIIPPEYYTKELVEFIGAKVIELTYTANDLDGFGKAVLQEIGLEKWNSWFPANTVKNGKVTPFIWDEERRFTLQRELDAIYAHIYGLSKLDLEYILDTFPIVEKNDIEKYGYFRTKNEVIIYYDEYSDIQSYSS